MANIKVPVRWWGGVGNDKVVQREDGHCYADLELELARTVFMIVDRDCGQGNVYVEKGIAPALAAARAVGMQVVYIHECLFIFIRPGSSIEMKVNDDIRLKLIIDTIGAGTYFTHAIKKQLA